MEIIDSSKIIYLSKNENNASIYLPQNREGIRKNTIMLNGTGYYKKECDSYHLINELIGSYLCHIIELDAVDTKVATDGKDLFALSELFYKEGYEYYYPFEFSDNPEFWKIRYQLSYMLNKYNNALSILNNNMLIKILKLIPIDLRMGLTDRKGTNIMFECLGNSIDFSTFYDFGCSYNHAEFYAQYKNDFITLTKDKESIKELIDMYPILFEYINLIRNLEIDNILSDIKSTNGINISDEEIKHYREKDKIYNGLLRRL